MNASRISIAMCTFNGSRYLPEQLESIASQTRVPDELIICDDMSTDNTLDLLKDFAARAHFDIHIVSNAERLGPAQNFEKAIRLCKGEIIALADQDDVWMPPKLQGLMEAFERNPDALYAFSDAEMMDQEGALVGQRLWDIVGIREKLTHFSGPAQLRILLKHNLITGATMALRASFKNIVLPIAPEWMHDNWIVLLGSALYSGVPIPEPLMMYRRHASQVCGWRKKTLLRVIKDSLETNQEDWQRKVEHFHRFSERIHKVSESIPCPPECLELIQEKEKHLLKRARIRSSSGISRITKVVGEAFSGRYQRYSNSWQSIVRDL